MHTMKTNQIVLDFHSHVLPEWFVSMFLTKKEHVVETQRVIQSSSSLNELIFGPQGLSCNFPQDLLPCQGEDYKAMSCLLRELSVLRNILGQQRSFSGSQEQILCVCTYMEASEQNDGPGHLQPEDSQDDVSPQISLILATTHFQTVLSRVAMLSNRLQRQPSQVPHDAERLPISYYSILK